MAARWKHSDPPEMPDYLERFRAVDWLADGEEVTDPDFDIWEHVPWYRRPRTDDEVLRRAFKRFRTARKAWERWHPEYVAAQVAELAERRAERRRQREAVWLRRLEEEEQ